jgi:cobalt transporter subunit CbtB
MATPIIATSSSTTPSTTPSTTAVGASHRSAAVGAVLLGSVLLFLVGFAPMPAVHNAAHDTRHSAAFPCH